MPNSGKHLRRTAVAVGAVLALGAGLFAGLGPTAGFASSHREAPFAAENPKIDATDLYAFTSPNKPSTVTFVSNWLPFENPAGGPNFYSFQAGAYYDINIDNNGDAKPDIVYRWVFSNHYRNKTTFLYNTGVVNNLTDSTLNFYQTYNLYRIVRGKSHTILRGAMVVPSDVGVASMPDYGALVDQGTYRVKGTRTFSGQSDDPFFLDLRVFDLLYGAHLGTSCLFAEACTDTLHGYNVQTMVLQIPKSVLAMNGDASANPIIGVTTTAEMKSVRTVNSNDGQSFSGPFVQVARLGSPLVNEVVIPVGLKNKFNSSKPANDGQFASFVTDPEVPKLVQAIFGIPAPATPRNDLVQAFLTGFPGLNQPPNVVASEELRLNMSTPLCGTGGAPACSRLGVVGNDPQGYPNGRRLSDDVIDIELTVLEHTALNDGVDANDKPFLGSFPYVALPWPGSDANPHA